MSRDRRTAIVADGPGRREFDHAEDGLVVDLAPTQIQRLAPRELRKRMTIWRFEQGPRFDSPGSDASAPSVPSDGQPPRYVGSGKAAIALILEHLRKTGTLRGKMTPILMPQWLGTWVYAQTLLYGFPTIDPSAQSPVVFVYHQYGFPQHMDRVLEIAEDRDMVVVEDCAHAADSRFRDRRLGTIGAYALFSYSKFLFCHALGGVQSADPSFDAFADERLRGSSRLMRLFVNGFKLADEWNADRDWPIRPRTFDRVRQMAYSLYGDQLAPGARAVRLWERKWPAEKAARLANYALLRNHVDAKGLCDHLEPADVVPYAVPLKVSEPQASKLIEALVALGIKAGRYQFDYNRCLFEPDFRPCVLVPIHSGMTGNGMDRLLHSLKAI